MKKILKFLIFILIIVIIVIIYFYIKPAIQVEQLEVENNIPIKIAPYSSFEGNDSIVIFIPYKFRVSNNRLKQIKINHVTFKNKLSTGIERDLLFDKKGYLLGKGYNSQAIDSLLFNKEIINYLQLKHNKEVFPFSDKEYYFYKPFLFSKFSIKGLDNNDDYIKLVHNFFKHQTLKLHNKSNLNINEKIIDSLYKNSLNTKIILNYGSLKTNDYINDYDVEFYLGTKKQNLIDFSKMTTDEIIKYLSNNRFDK
ncbi:hypothetical protein [Flavobacterium sp.]|uniref:hypothetical protein n=1 Tax=Flavobacterium sp. TaxID=239 RepID=UPI003527D92A